MCDVATFASAEQDAGGTSAVVPVELLVQLLESSRSLQETLASHQVDPSHVASATAAADWRLKHNCCCVCTSATFPRAGGDLNLLCFVSFHHHFPLFDFYLLIYFC